MARIQVVPISMNTWNLKLVNIQRTMREHTWDLHSMLTFDQSEPDQHETPADLVRILANSKSRFSREEQDADSCHHRYCNSFLRAAGINRDLISRPERFRGNLPPDPYQPPASQPPFVNHGPESLAADLYHCTIDKDDVYTVEDKDPSILWRLRSNRIYDFWYYLMTNATTRWEIQTIPDETILQNYRTILDYPPQIIHWKGRQYILYGTCPLCLLHYEL